MTCFFPNFEILFLFWVRPQPLSQSPSDSRYFFGRSFNARSIKKCNFFQGRPPSLCRWCQRSQPFLITCPYHKQFETKGTPYFRHVWRRPPAHCPDSPPPQNGPSPRMGVLFFSCFISTQAYVLHFSALPTTFSGHLFL